MGFEAKICSKCDEHKQPGEFARVKEYKGRSARLSSHCKECKKDYHRKHWAENRERLCAQQNAAKEKKKARKACDHCGVDFVGGGSLRQRWCYECVPANDKAAQSRMARYGLSRPEFDAMYEKQGGKCAMADCPREATCVDHNHDTGAIRALLCRGCNSHLSWFERDDHMQRALSYLRSHGANV